MFRLQHVGDGRLHALTGSEQREIIEKFPVGAIVSCDLEKFRSRAQNNTFFGFLAYVWETTEAQDLFFDPDYMRAQLFVDAGYETVHRVKFPMEAPEFLTVITTLVIKEKAKGKPLIYGSTPEGDVLVHIPKSWEFPKGKKGLEHPDAVALMTACFEILSAKYVPGLDTDLAMAEYKASIARNKLGKKW